MPADTTKPSSSRRIQKRLTDEELQDIEQKRLKGELSCAECRRLKLRCDKKVPCGSCLRRGCESICPLGILAAGQGTRFILADTEHLHEKIYAMSNRIRQLEDALAILQSAVSEQKHPLLADELLRVKFGSESMNAPQLASEEQQPQEARLGGDSGKSKTAKSIDALGTLTLGSSGEFHYFGRSGGSETLMLKAGKEVELESPSDEDREDYDADTVDAIDNLANLFPFCLKYRPNIEHLNLVQAFLPSRERALSLCTLYNDHAALFFRPIKEDELLDDLIPLIFRTSEIDSIPVGTATVSSEKGRDHNKTVNGNLDRPHALAALYFVFALGALLDLSLPPYNSEAERYYGLGRAALSLRAIYDAPNMDAVVAMGLMATYHSLAGKRYSRDSAWSLMSFAAKLAQSIGLHRDSARWHMEPKMVQRRRNLFWEVFSADLSHSLALGRPPAIHLSYVDCEFPQDLEAVLSEDGTASEPSSWRLKYIFARDIYIRIANMTLTASTPSYNTILDLDKDVREIPVPKSFNPYITDAVGEEIFFSSSRSLRDFYASQHRTVTMLYLHRSFFAQAMLDHPTNPLLSPFAPSFLTAYRSAAIIIKASVNLFGRCERMGMRVWFLLGHTFSAAVIVGTVITRSPDSSIAGSAMKDFNLAIGLFEKTALQSQRAKTALGVLLKLREKATRTFEHRKLPQDDEGADIEDDLAIFGGQMRILDGANPKKKSSHHQKSMSPTSSLGNDLGFSPLSIREIDKSSLTGGNDGYKGRASLDGVKSHVSNVGLPASSYRDLGEIAPSSSSNTQISYLKKDSQQIMASNQLARTSTTQLSDTTRETFTEPAFMHHNMNCDQTLPSEAFMTGPISMFSTSPNAASTQYGQPSPPLTNTVSDDGWSSSGIAAYPHYQEIFGRPFSQRYIASTIPITSPPAEVFSTSQYPSGTMYPPGQAYPQSCITDAYTSTVNLSHVTSDHAGPTDLGNDKISHGFSEPLGLAWPTTFLNSPMDQAGAIDMGLSSESGMDRNWVQFMRDCGIMDIDSTGS